MKISACQISHLFNRVERCGAATVDRRNGKFRPYVCAHFLVTATVVCMFFSSSLACANPVAGFYTRRTQQLAGRSFQHWQRASAMAANSSTSLRVKYSGGTKAMAAARQEALREYLSRLVPATEPSSDVAHIPDEYAVSTETSKKKWTAYYARAKNGLRPHVEYAFKSNAHKKKAGTVTLSEEHIENLQDNFDILMWYRNELESGAMKGNHRGDRKFKLFLDYFVADLLKSMPSAPRISISTGSVDAPKWEVDERKLREQLIMAYRYLIAKYQIYPDYEDFGPADRELLMTMMKIALLMGANMNPEWFHDKDVNLNASSKTANWKEPMAEALEVLKDQTDDDARPVDEQLRRERYEEPCIITIPPPKPRKAVKAASDPKTQDTQKIEIIVRPNP